MMPAMLWAAGADVSIDQSQLIIIGAIVGLVLQFLALFAALRKAIAGPIEREIATQMELVAQKFSVIRDDIRGEHDGLGRRITPVELSLRETETRLTSVERESGMARERYGYMSEKMGALESQQKAHEAAMRKLAEDLTTTILEASRAQSAALNALQIEVAKFQATYQTERQLRRQRRAHRKDP